MIGQKIDDVLGSSVVREMKRGAGVAALVLWSAVTPDAAAVTRSATLSALHDVAFCRPGCVVEVTGARRERNAGRRSWSFLLESGEGGSTIRFRPLVVTASSAANTLALTVTNASARPLALTIRASGARGEVQAESVLPARRSTRLELPLYRAATGMVALPPAYPARTRFLNRPVGVLHAGPVVALTLSVDGRGKGRRLQIGVAKLRHDDWHCRLRSIADRFGQFTRATWPGKVANTPALQARRAATQAAVVRELARSMAAADRFGGLFAPVGLAATGFFHTAQRNGRWWLVTPEGHAFFSLGVDTVSPEAQTEVATRPFLFRGDPWPDDLPNRGAGARARQAGYVDVLTSNIERELGADWRRRWPRQTTDRLRAWGFNTLGNWSDPAVTNLQTLPAAATLSFVPAATDLRLPSGRTIADPFDPGFAAAVDAAAGAAAAGRVGDPWLIGYFAGNEWPWQGLARATLAGSGGSARTALMKLLHARYASAGNLAAAWRKPELKRWEDLEPPLSLPDDVAAAAVRDFDAFETLFADRWFSTVAEALHRHDPHHLFLGTRFAVWTAQALQACARWCDVLSFNLYARDPARSATAAAWRALGKPVLISEFHFGSDDRGDFWPGLVDAGSEAGRAPAYAAYVSAMAGDLAVIGCHWFAYADEPVTGRLEDGENGHIGLVAVTDLPWDAFVQAVGRTNRAVLRRLEGEGRARPSQAR